MTNVFGKNRKKYLDFWFGIYELDSVYYNWCLWTTQLTGDPCNTLRAPDSAAPFVWHIGNYLNIYVSQTGVMCCFVLEYDVPHYFEPP